MPQAQMTQTVLPVDSAQAKYPDLRTFWARSVARTCGPNNGVCHDNRQFPDMQTASGLLDAVNKRCNQIRDNPSSIDNLCEPLGDSIQIGGFVTRIGTITPQPSATAPTSLAITTRDPVPAGASGSVAIVRQPPNLPKVVLPVPSGAMQAAADHTITLEYSTLTNKTTAPAPGGSLAGFLLPAVFTPGDDTQVELGDPNGDGIFGADLGGALIKPGDPLKSYLFLRVLSPIAVGPGQMLTNTAAPASTEAQMPIANFQYWDVDHDMVALWCWISTMKTDGSNADGPIDYAHCDTSQMPQVMHQDGEAITFSSVYASVLSPNCSSCHHSGTTQATTFYMNSLQDTYDVLLGIQGTGPSENKLGLPYVTKSDPTKSYLYLKVTGSPLITGAKMPLGGALPQSALDDLNNWISQGANND
jgi:hypothetical protein